MYSISCRLKHTRSTVACMIPSKKTLPLSFPMASNSEFLASVYDTMQYVVFHQRRGDRRVIFFAEASHAGLAKTTDEPSAGVVFWLFSPSSKLMLPIESSRLVDRDLRESCPAMSTATAIAAENERRSQMRSVAIHSGANA